MTANPENILFDRDVIERRVRELADEISRDYRGKDLVIVAVLKGAFMFLSDLTRHLSVQAAVDFARLASYGSSTKSAGSVEIRKDIEIAVGGRDVLIVEDIIDTGSTISLFAEELRKRNPRSLRTCTLIDKKERREVDFTADYVGFSLDKGFIVGYGLDYDEKYRCLPHICLLDENNLPGETS